MASTRGQANQSIYLARILLTAWNAALAEQGTPAQILASAFLPAVREHLMDAYGWFLLEILRPANLPDRAPRCCADLPGITQGKAIPPEIRECQQLEANGWLGEMLGEVDIAPAVRSHGNLAAPVIAEGPGQACQWADSLQALFDRMADSLDEY